MNLTEKQYQEIMRDRGIIVPRPLATAHEPKPKFSKTELSFINYLELQERLGLVKACRHQGITFKLAEDVRYTPDAMAVLPDYKICFYDVKGEKMVTRKSGAKVSKPFVHEDARIKIAVAAALYPWFIWRQCWWERKTGEWLFREM